MPENPLLPNRQLQQLYTSMLRARESSTGRSDGFEAIVATVAQQLEPGDVIVPTAQGGAFEQLSQTSRVTPPAAIVPSSANPLAFAAGLAAAAQLAGQNRLVAVLLDAAQPEPALARLLDHAQRMRLPVVVICPEIAGKRKAGADLLTWATLSRIVKKLRFPLLTVDGGDAVAVYRAVQESVLRARQGDGPALLWCLRSELGRKETPLARLERYMNARKISLPRTSSKGF